MSDKILLIICDGMADRPVRQLGGKTPLEFAETPFMDKLAEIGCCGIMDPISPGIPPGSDAAHLAIFGYDPTKVKVGRGYLEAVGCGLEVEEGDIAFRCNFATLDGQGIIVDRRAGRKNIDGKVLAEAINNIKLAGGIEVTFKPTVEHRGVLVLRGENLSPEVTDIDPHRIGVPPMKAKPKTLTKDAKRTAEIINTLVKEINKILANHPYNKERVKAGLPPANTLLLRGASTKPKIKPITEKYRIKAAVVAGGALYKGVGGAVGMKIVNVEGATGTVDTNIAGKFEKAIELLKEEYNLVFLHIKAVDNLSHDGDLKGKIDFISRIDKVLGKAVEEYSLDRCIICLTADHATPVEVGQHSGDSVPIVMAGPQILSDNIKRFSERHAAQGNLNRIRGMHLMPILMNFIGRMELFEL